MSYYSRPEDHVGDDDEHAVTWTADEGAKPLEREIEMQKARNADLQKKVERLTDDLANMYRLRRECVALIDDLCDLVSRPAFPPEWFAERDRLVARCQEDEGTMSDFGPTSQRRGAQVSGRTDAEWLAECEAERALADYLYTVLDENFNDKGMFIYEEDTVVQAVVDAKARWREARGL